LDFSVKINVAPNPALLNGLYLPTLTCPSDPDGGLLLNGRDTNPQWYGPSVVTGDKSMGQSYAISGGPINNDACIVAVLNPNINCLSSNGGSGVKGSPGMFASGSIGTRVRDCTDGLSNTFLLGEQLPIYNSWMMYFNSVLTAATTNVSPNQHLYDMTNCRRVTEPASDRQGGIISGNVCTGFKSHHSGGVQFLFADGSVHFISQNIDYRTYQFLGNKADGNTIGDY
ncbi:MAG TPA: DUF1559 domain-containing protein, partial [Planctomicrobium sp.]|nr:DUF1559 domain-containing protein [Planctomicrobium sp.]